ncbi:NADH-quinone oxidoreductase subunit C [Coprothermobacteraceae bacterium]|nr:NADH-quinone oxidoreductase subunit C [Coprothermobacteraceae bacterium]
MNDTLSSLNYEKRELRARQWEVLVPAEQVEGVLSLLKPQFRHLMFLTCVDWIEQGEFELVYGLFDWDRGESVLIKTRIPRDNPKFKSLRHIYLPLEVYEREVHEMFGVVFEGNDRQYEPYVLEDWDDIPPLRKDFDPEKYIETHPALANPLHDELILELREGEQL